MTNILSVMEYFMQKLIANVGIKSMILNNKNKELAFSRHATVLKNIED